MTAPDLALNCSLALRDVAPHERAETAAVLGYGAAEFWWPFAEQTPSAGQIRDFVDSLHRAEIPAVLLNFPGGGPSVEDRGLLSVPGREDDFLKAAETAIRIGSQVGTTRYNPMAGNIPGTWSEGSAEFETALSNLLRVAPMVTEAGAALVLEPLSGFPAAALKTFAEARLLVEAARRDGAADVAILHDLFHLAQNKDPVLQEPAAAVDLIGHVQVADAPGRGWPGTGQLPLERWLEELRAHGYAGVVGLECIGRSPWPATTAFRPVAESGPR